MISVIFLDGFCTVIEQSQSYDHLHQNEHDKNKSVTQEELKVQV